LSANRGVGPCSRLRETFTSKSKTLWVRVLSFPFLCRRRRTELCPENGSLNSRENLGVHWLMRKGPVYWVASTVGTPPAAVRGTPWASPTPEDETPRPRHELSQQSTANPPCCGEELVSQGNATTVPPRTARADDSAKGPGVPRGPRLLWRHPPPTVGSSSRRTSIESPKAPLEVIRPAEQPADAVGATGPT